MNPADKIERAKEVREMDMKIRAQSIADDVAMPIVLDEILKKYNLLKG